MHIQRQKNLGITNLFQVLTASHVRWAEVPKEVHDAGRYACFGQWREDVSSFSAAVVMVGLQLCRGSEIQSSLPPTATSKRPSSS